MFDRARPGALVLAMLVIPIVPTAVALAEDDESGRWSDVVRATASEVAEAAVATAREGLGAAGPAPAPPSTPPAAEPLAAVVREAGEATSDVWGIVGDAFGVLVEAIRDVEDFDPQAGRLLQEFLDRYRGPPPDPTVDDAPPIAERVREILIAGLRSGASEVIATYDSIRALLP